MEPAAATSGPPPIDTGDRSVRQFAALLFSRFWLVTWVFLGVVGVSVYTFFFFLSPTYEVKATIIIDPSDVLLPLVETMPPSDLDKLTTFHTQKDILTSAPIVERAVKRLKLDETRVLSRWEKLKLRLLGYRKVVGKSLGIASWTKDQDLHALCVDAVSSALHTETRLDSRAISIAYSSRDPHEAANTLNTLIEEYREFFYERIRTRAAGVSSYLEAQMEQVDKDLKGSEQDLLKLKQQDTLELDRKDGLNLAGVDAQAPTDGSAKARPMYLTGIADSTAAQNQIKVYLVSLEDELRKMSSQYVPSDPALQSIKKRIDNYTRVLAALPSRELALARKRRVFDINQELYLFMRRNLERSRIVQEGNSAMMGIVNVIEPAVANETPSSPKKWANLLICSVFGALFAGMCALVANYFDHSIRTSMDIERYLGTRLLGSLGMLGSRVPKLAASEPLSALLTPKADSSLARLLNSEASRKFFNAWDSERFLTFGDAPLAVTVAASVPHEGASSIALLVAAHSAALRPDKPVLLIDGSLAEAALSRRLGLELERAGLAEVMHSQLDAAQALVETALPGLHVLPAGAADRSRGFSATAFREMFERIRGNYDLVVIDAPSARSSRDAIALAKIAGNALLVVSSGGPNREQVRSFLSSLARAQVQLLGAVLNKRKYPLPKWLYEVA